MILSPNNSWGKNIQGCWDKFRFYWSSSVMVIVVLLYLYFNTAFQTWSTTGTRKVSMFDPERVLLNLIFHQKGILHYIADKSPRGEKLYTKTLKMSHSIFFINMIKLILLFSSHLICNFSYLIYDKCNFWFCNTFKRDKYKYIYIVNLYKASRKQLC